MLANTALFIFGAPNSLLWSIWQEPAVVPGIDDAGKLRDKLQRALPNPGTIGPGYSLIDGDNHLAASVPFFDVSDRFLDLVEFVSAIDHRLEFS